MTGLSLGDRLRKVGATLDGRPDDLDAVNEAAQMADAQERSTLEPSLVERIIGLIMEGATEGDYGKIDEARETIEALTATSPSHQAERDAGRTETLADAEKIEEMKGLLKEVRVILWANGYGKRDEITHRIDAALGRLEP